MGGYCGVAGRFPVTRKGVCHCDFGKVSVYTPSKGCVGLHVVWIIYKC